MVVTNDDQMDADILAWNEGDMPYSTVFGDQFYCRTDGRAECDHVFLAGNGLPARWQYQDLFRIGELGFGTGLNACQTQLRWAETRKPGQQLHYVSFELYPMKQADIDRALSRWPEIDAQRLRLLAGWPDDPQGVITCDMGDGMQMSVVCGPAAERLAETPTLFDAWYLDGFAPSRNPDMWSAGLMQAVFDHTVPGGSFATYAAAGFVRRNLQAAGFVVERSPGFAGKREMLSGRKPVGTKIEQD